LAAARERSGSKRRGRGDIWGLALVVALDLQLLLGLLLYFALSPYTAGVRANFEVVMQDPTLRFWNVDHVAVMLVAVLLVHVGRVLARKASSVEKRRFRLLLYFGIATLLMIAGTPWTNPESRPLFRFGF